VRMELWSHYTVKVALIFILQFLSALPRPGKSRYTKTAIRDHGRDLEDLPWEQVGQAALFAKICRRRLPR
jgi:hypothetical protein